MSPTAIQAIKNINSGTAPYQRRRELNRKILMGAAQAVLTGGVGVLKAHESYDLENEQKARAKNSAVKSAIKNAKLPPSSPGPDTYKDEYGLPVAQPLYNKQMDNSVMGGASSPRPAADVAKETMASADAHEAALAAPIAGHWTAKGFQDADMNASVNANDIDRAKAMMRQASQEQSFGGLGNSFSGGK